MVNLSFPSLVRVGAHRGAHDAGAPENSLAAFERAVALGCDFVELDVRRAADGRLAVCHDPDVGGRRLADLTLAEAQRLAAERGGEIPALEDALAVMSGRLQVDIEIKEPGYERDVLAAAARILPPESYFISSFELSVLEAAAALAPAVRRGWIVGDRQARWWRRARIRRVLPLLAAAVLAPPAFLIPRHTLVDAPLAELCRRQGVALIPWTVNDPVEMRRLAGLGAWGIVTDRPAEAFSLLRT